MIISSKLTKELQDVIIVCLAFGLRRIEVESLRYKDINITEKETTILVKSSNGHSRIVVANKTYEQEFRKVFQQKGVHNPEDLFIDHKIPKHFDFHSLRAEAAKTLFQELKLNGEISKEEILKQVAKFLGLNRTDLVREYYLKKGNNIMHKKTTQYKRLQDLPLFFSVETLAEIMGIGLANAYTLCHSKGFPSIYINRRIVISRDGFETWLKSQIR
jgi:integrase